MESFLESLILLDVLAIFVLLTLFTFNPLTYAHLLEKTRAAVRSSDTCLLPDVSLGRSFNMLVQKSNMNMNVCLCFNMQQVWVIGHVGPVPVRYAFW